MPRPEATNEMQAAPRSTPIDTSKTLDISWSIPVFEGLVAGGFLTVVGLAFLNIDRLGNVLGVTLPRSKFVFVGWSTLIVFGTLTIFFLWMAATKRGTVVTLSPDGLRDARFSTDLVPWSAVRSVSSKAQSSTRVVVLELEPETWRNLSLTRAAQIARRLRPSYALNRAWISAKGTSMDHDALFAACADYWEAARRAPA